ncbi:MAG: BTAD domain-containing putative transcriptional regulator [bacterium]|nr:BTAD domain-containing putative transcriptional regulator [bacterium]
MSMKLCFHITMFGDFSITYDNNLISDKGKHSKKCLFLLEFLIANRNARYSNNDIIDLFWPEDTSENPLGALKTLLHRTRSMLKNANFPSTMIIQENGTYRLNTNYTYQIDCEEFDEISKKLNHCSDKAAYLPLYEHAFHLYQGPFLATFSYESWILPINTYYHSRYLKLMNEYINLLLSKEEYPQIASICCHALSIDRFDEDLHYYFIYSLYKSGKQSAAIEQYKLTIELLRTKYNITPSERFLNLYKLIINTPGMENNDLLSILNTLYEGTSQEGGFFCEYAFFKEVFHYVARTSIRTGDDAYLCLLTIVNKYNGTLEKTTINKAMHVLSQTIQVSLRRNDLFTQYSPCQYIILLPNTNQSGGELVLHRIVHKYQCNNDTITTVTTKILPILEQDLLNKATS